MIKLGTVKSHGTAIVVYELGHDRCVCVSGCLFGKLCGAVTYPHGNIKKYIQLNPPKKKKLFPVVFF